MPTVEEIKNEGLLGQITNLFLFGGTEGPFGRNPNYYVSYNLVFTSKSIYGEHLENPGMIQEGGYANVFFKGYGHIEDVGKILAKSAITNNTAINAQNIDISVNYEKIKHATLKPYTIDFSILAKTPSVNSAMLVLEAGLLGSQTTRFVFGEALFNQLASLINKTPLSNKLIVKT